MDYKIQFFSNNRNINETSWLNVPDGVVLPTDDVENFVEEYAAWLSNVSITSIAEANNTTALNIIGQVTYLKKIIEKYKNYDFKIITKE